MKMSLCPMCDQCPEVEIAGDEVRVGEAGNLAVLDDLAHAGPRVEPGADHVPLGDVGRQEGADEGGGEEGVPAGSGIPAMGAEDDPDLRTEPHGAAWRGLAAGRQLVIGAALRSDLASIPRSSHSLPGRVIYHWLPATAISALLVVIL